MKLGFGKSSLKSRDGGSRNTLMRKSDSQGSTLENLGELPKAVEISERKVNVSGVSVDLGMVAVSDKSVTPQSRSPQVDVSAMDVSDDTVINREGVGRVSNSLSKRAELARNQDHAMLSRSMRTLESLVSTGSQAEYFHPKQSIIIFDWDDTLCPSHWIRINRPKLQYFQPCPNEPRYKVPLETLSDQVIKVLRASVAISKTIILTNAQVTWVEVSCRNFMPRVWPIIKELGIDIVYARQSVEQDISTCRDLDYNYNANAPQLWKERAMKDNISKFYSQYLHQSWKNIVSIGDQICEHNALRIVALARPTGKKKCRTKTVKLIEEPSIENLIAENQVIIQWLGGLVQYDGELTVDLSHDDDILLDLHNMLSSK
jgi:hypothetical protein